jgi:hypothetical protein
MGEQDSQRGKEGQGWASGVNYNDWLAGKQARGAGTPTVYLPTGPSLGIAAVPLAFLALVMYPVAGLGSFIGLLTMIVPMEMLNVHGGFFFLFAAGGAVAGFLFALKFERTASQNAMYRMGRMVFRLIVPTLVFIRMATRPHAMAAPKEAGPQHYLIGLILTAVLVWFFAKMDKRYGLVQYVPEPDEPPPAPGARPSGQPSK